MFCLIHGIEAGNGNSNTTNTLFNRLCVLHVGVVMAKQDKYTRSARGKECQIRIPGVCNGNPDTVVLAHLNGAGMGMKHANIHGAYACSACHDAVDGRLETVKYQKIYSQNEKKLMHLEGVIRTQQIMIKEGVLKL